LERVFFWGEGDGSPPTVEGELMAGAGFFLRQRRPDRSQWEPVEAMGCIYALPAASCGEGLNLSHQFPYRTYQAHNLAKTCRAQENKKT